MPHRYTEEQDNFIRTISPGRYNSEIAKLFNVKFGTEITANQIKSYKNNHGIKSGVPKRSPLDDTGLFTKEQRTFIKDHVYGISNQVLADLVNQKFNLSITAKQMKAWKRNRKISSGLKGSEGMEPPNKGTKGIYNVGGNCTSFKKGRRATNYLPVGSERVDRDGYTLVKVSDRGAWHHRWKHKHKNLWEKVNGPIPKGHCLIFLDGNKQNISLENLQLITRSQLARLNQHHLISDNPEFTKAGIVIADIYNKMGELKNKQKDA